MRRAAASTAGLTAAALAASLYVALTVGGLGDYPGDGGPALTALLHGDLPAFAAAKPAMGAFALLIRVPFAALAHAGGGVPTQLAVYRLGAIPCVAAIGLLGVALAGLARERGSGRAGQIAIVALAVLNPFVESALQLGHPEELLTTALAVGAVVAAAHRRHLPTAVLLGLALASKQWAVIAVFPVVAILTAHRLRTLAGSAAIAAAVSLPAFVGSPGAFLAGHVALVHEHYLEPSVYSWLFPLAPQVTVRLGGGLVHQGAHLPAGLVGLLHPLIIGVALAIAVALARLARRARRRGVDLDPDQVFAAVALAFLLRCTLDTETMPYYHAPLFATLLAWDAMRGERLPVRALAAAAVGYVLFDRLTLYVVSPAAAAWLYGAVALVGAAILLARLRPAAGRGRGREPRRPAAEPAGLSA